MTQPPDLLAATLAERLQKDHSDWNVGQLVAIGSGLEFLVYRAPSARGDLAIKTPRAPVFSNDNDAHVVARELLEQDVALAAHAAVGGVPVPKVIALELGREPIDYLVQAFVPHDGAPPDPSALGHLVGRLHALPPPERPLVAQQGRPIHELLVERLCRRASVVERLAARRLDLPAPRELAAILRSTERPRALLHMDVRPANVLGLRGEIGALIDWSNALAGDPALEIARIAEYGHVGPQFLAGYRRAFSLPPPPAAMELVYRLDTAIMLAVVFLSEQPDAERGRAQVERVVALAGELARR